MGAGRTGDGGPDLRRGGRSLSKVAEAARHPHTYRAVVDMYRLSRRPSQTLMMYLSGMGHYPRRSAVRTPMGQVAPTIYSHHDLLTLNEVFFRQDYRCDSSTRVVLDLGSNIGLSALYFLTRGPGVRCHLIEPVPENVSRLRRNLSAFTDRWTLRECAVDATSGIVDFGTEDTGRYGGIGKSTGHAVRLPCSGINDVLEGVLAAEGSIDVLKIDTEGAELRTVAAIDRMYLPRIGRIFMEVGHGNDLTLAGFERHNFRTIYRYTNLHFARE